MTTPTLKLATAGLSIWFDDLSGSRITSGNLREVIDTSGAMAVTDAMRAWAAVERPRSEDEGIVKLVGSWHDLQRTTVGFLQGASS